MSWKNRFDWPFPVDFLAGQKYLANVLQKTIKRFFLLAGRVTFVRFLEKKFARDVPVIYTNAVFCCEQRLLDK